MGFSEIALVFLVATFQSAELQNDFKISECGKSKFCYRGPNPKCDPLVDCDYFASFNTSISGDKLYFEIAARRPYLGPLTLRDQYIAIGFTKENKMGPASVMECVILQADTKHEIRFSQNHQYYNSRINLSTSQVKSIAKLHEAAVLDDHLICRFERKVRTPSRLNRKVPSLDTEKIRIMISTGAAYPTGIGKHDTKPNVSPTLRIAEKDFSKSVFTTTSTTTVLPTTTHPPFCVRNELAIKKMQVLLSSHMGAEVQRTEISGLFKEADSNRDGQLDLEEFVAFWSL